MSCSARAPKLRQTRRNQSWGSLTIYALMDSALNGLSEQFFDQTPFDELPISEQKKILKSIRGEVYDRLEKLREKE